mmetsp:Transcript_30870/g.64767  ORF Transcript_30870/g.64767 Transcript_30870/m.64767 type:complete len:242 (+) Transcript_30870:1217-1942(+)
MDCGACGRVGAFECRRSDGYSPTRSRSTRRRRASRRAAPRLPHHNLHMRLPRRTPRRRPGGRRVHRRALRAPRAQSRHSRRSARREPGLHHCRVTSPRPGDHCVRQPRRLPPAPWLRVQSPLRLRGGLRGDGLHARPDDASAALRHLVEPVRRVLSCTAAGPHLVASAGVHANRPARSGACARSEWMRSSRRLHALWSDGHCSRRHACLSLHPPHRGEWCVRGKHRRQASSRLLGNGGALD